MAAGELHTLLETERSQPLAEREPPGDRPWVALNMASSADGRAAVGGTSGGLGSEADHRRFAALRRETDSVLVGTGIDLDAASPGFVDALRDLRARRDVRVVLCEGGRRVVGALLAQGLLDEVFITLSPLLVGGGVKNVIEGPGLSPPAPLELIRVLESDGYLFLRYLVAQPG